MAANYLVRLGDDVRQVEVEEGPDGLRLAIDGQWHQVRLEQVGQSSLYALVIDDRPHELFALERADGFDIVIGPDRYPVAVAAGERRPPPAPAPPLAEKPGEAGGWVVLSPMTGMVAEVYVSPKERVSEGAVLLVIEAMKMNNELRAQRAGLVEEVYVAKGHRVEQGMALLLLI